MSLILYLIPLIKITNYRVAIPDVERTKYRVAVEPETQKCDRQFPPPFLYPFLNAELSNCLIYT